MNKYVVFGIGFAAGVAALYMYSLHFYASNMAVAKTP